MKRVTVRNLTLQFDTDLEIEDLVEFVSSTVDLINLSLRREPYGIDAQLSTYKVDPADYKAELKNIEVEDIEVEPIDLE